MVIDILFLIIIALAVFKGLRRGLIMAIFSILGFIIGLAAALKLSVFAASKLSTYTGNAKWLQFISFFLVFIAVVVLVNITGRLIEKTFQTVMLGWVNRSAGVILYLFLYSFVYSIFLFYAVQLHFIKQDIIAGSFIYPYLKPLGIKVISGLGILIPWFKNMFAELEKFFFLFSHPPR